MIAFDLPAPDRHKDGGVAYVCHELANRLAARGHSVEVISLNESPPDAAYRVRTLPFAKGFLRHRALRYYVAPVVARLVRLGSHDVLHSHGDTWCFFGVRLPTLRTFYGSALDEALHAESWVRRLNHLLLYLLELLSGLAADDIIAISRNTARRLPMRCSVIPCAVDLNTFMPGPKSASPSILFVGTLRGRKRGWLLLDAYRRIVRPTQPDAELWMVCGESGPPTEGVRWLPRQSTEDLAELYRRAWIFCLPSNYEGFGIPYIEAMASGTPVLATRNAGARELLGDGTPGWIVDDAELGAALLSLIADHDLRSRLASAGRTRAMDYSWDKMLAAYEERYRAIASQDINRRDRLQ